MKYYITADVHGFYTEFHKALDETETLLGFPPVAPHVFARRKSALFFKILI